MDISLFGTLRKLKLSSSSLRLDDDFVDRLNHYYTGILILVFTIIVSAKQYVGQPLQCWVPATFTSAMEQYAENFCWVQSTYFVSLKDEIPIDIRKRENRKLNYYQWVPFVLILQALLFYIPCVVWRLLNWQSGINVQGIVRLSCDAQNIDIDKRQKIIKNLSKHIQDALNTQKEICHTMSRSQRFRARLSRIFCCFCLGKRFGNYLVIVYVFTKLLYIANSVGQFFLLNHFLGANNSFYGPYLLHGLWSGNSWEHSGQFPRVTLCDFQIKVLANSHRHTVQCVLMINLFNEKIFIFLWFWIFIITIITTCSLFVWIGRMCMPRSRYNFVFRYLRIIGKLNKRDKTKLVDYFIGLYLRMDGLFILRLVALNAGDIITTDVVAQLWMHYKNKKSTLAVLTDDENENLPPDVV